MTSALYICVGENYRGACRMGFCGDTHTLKKWIELLFPNNIEQALNFFIDDKDTEITDYLYRNKGKRLKKAGK